MIHWLFVTNVEHPLTFQTKIFFFQIKWSTLNVPFVDATLHLERLHLDMCVTWYVFLILKGQ